jgi:hypothetical protein
MSLGEQPESLGVVILCVDREALKVYKNTISVPYLWLIHHTKKPHANKPKVRL